MERHLFSNIYFCLSKGWVGGVGGWRGEGEGEGGGRPDTRASSSSLLQCQSVLYVRLHGWRFSNFSYLFPFSSLFFFFLLTFPPTPTPLDPPIDSLSRKFCFFFISSSSSSFSFFFILFCFPYLSLLLSLRSFLHFFPRTRYIRAKFALRIRSLECRFGREGKSKRTKKEKRKLKRKREEKRSEGRKGKEGKIKKEKKNKERKIISIDRNDSSLPALFRFVYVFIVFCSHIPLFLFFSSFFLFFFFFFLFLSLMLNHDAFVLATLILYQKGKSCR